MCIFKINTKLIGLSVVSDKEVQKPGENKKELLKYDTHGSIVIVPTADDNDMDYTCEANHPAIPIDMPLRETIKLSVFCTYNFLIFPCYSYYHYYF